jgi:hypothetical protein
VFHTAILDTWEAEMVSNIVQSQSRQKFVRFHSTIAEHSGGHLSSQTMCEAEIGRVSDPGLPAQKCLDNSSQLKKAGCGGTSLSSQ